MDISFADAHLTALCEQERLAKRQLGALCAKKLRTRLADLGAAANVAELVAGRPHPLAGDRLGQFAVSLAGGVRLVFEPSHNPIPRSDDGMIDWRYVTKIRIVYIGDYHD
jgi:proteic killer suppression protein